MNQSRTVPLIPNHEEKRDNKMLWSIVSNAAARGQEDRDMIFLRACGIDEVVIDIQNSRLGRVVITVCRLVRIEEIIYRQILSETRFYNALFILFSDVTDMFKIGR